MDQQKLVALLQACQIPDTQKVKAATAELRKNFYPHPDSLLGLLHVIVSHSEPTVRMLAAVQALRLVPKHWKKIDGSQKPEVRNQLLQTIVNEQDAKCRHGQSRVIAAIATLDFDNNEWADLIPTVTQLATSENVVHREVGSYIIYSLLEANPSYFESHLAKLFELFTKTIRDPQSRDVRVNTMLSISAAIMLVDVDEDEEALNTVQEFIPAMVDVLKDAVQNDDDERIQQAFEVFQSFLAYESALISRYFKDLVQFMLELASNTAVDGDVRCQALAFLTQCVRYRRMKIQGVPDMAAQLMRKSLMILSELEDDDEEDDNTPARAALSLIDQLASDLPPRQVIVPLLDDFPKYATSENAGHRRACILALGNCAEGAPEFISTQIGSLMPAVLQLLQDRERTVRYSALVGLIRIGEDLADSMTAHHDAILTALLLNLDAASSDQSDKQNVEIIRSVCGVIDSLAEGLSSEVMAKYGETMIHRETMEAMSTYIMVESGEDELALRSAVCDAMGRIAVGVGAQEFHPYVIPLLGASEKALHLGNARLRETTFILWSQLATVYEGDLGDSLAGIFKGLFESLELEEEELDFDLSVEDGLIADKKDKTKGSIELDDDEDGMDDDDDDDDDWDDLAVELVAPFAEHSYEGCRKTAIGTLWRTYACVWEAMEKQTGQKWAPGLPLNFEPIATIAKLGEIVTTATMHIWQDEADRDVVTEINRSVASTLKATGPSILGQKTMMDQIITVLGTITTRCHPCQQDLGDEDENQDDVQGSSEWDWLIIDTALDVLIGLAAALGPQFAEIWKVFQKPVLKFISSNENIERSTAVGVVAECVQYMGSAVTPYTSTLLPPLLHRLSDEDQETKSNTAYALGQLVYHSEDEATYLPSFPQILSSLEPLLQIQAQRLQDNAAGCLCRMILSNPNQVPIPEVLPALVDLLPLKEDYEENKPVYQCLHKLYVAGNPTVQELTPRLIPVFEQVLSPPEDQLEDETRQLVIELVHNIKK
ncbi:hypothetical protein CIB48_g8427 [Xylaria polymorpha]|nr:hypothetical protein CIB48_g8427 [Xylaria polymorpha]